jgi:hypothetical protein
MKAKIEELEKELFDQTNENTESEKDSGDETEILTSD